MYRRWSPATLLLIACGCGYVGEPLPPLLNIPAAVVDLAAIQRGPRIVAQFTLPKLTTEGVLIKPPVHWDLRAGERGAGEFQVDAWAARAQTLTGASVENGRVRCESAASTWIGKEIVLAVRITGGRGPASAWSNLVTMTIIAPPATPRDVNADTTRDGVRLVWAGSGPSYRVFRRAEGEPGLSVVANTEAREFVDRATEYGKEYHYIVQAIAKTGTGEVESDLSIEATIRPRDIFPPATPTGLGAVPATNSIELGWERATDADLAGYRVYRALPGGDFERIAEIAETPSYSDRQIESGKQYRYAVSAFDKSGNESNRSDPIEVTAP